MSVCRSLNCALCFEPFLELQRKKCNFEIEEDRLRFLCKTKFVLDVLSTRVHKSLDLQEVEEIERLLADSVNYSDDAGRTFIEAVAETGLYKDRESTSRSTTLLHRAARINRGSVVEPLFQIYDRFDVNCSDESGLTHFHVACRYGCAGAVRKFIESDRDLVDCLVPDTGDSGLHLALACDSPVRSWDAVTALLRGGADPNLANKERSTPLHLICNQREKGHLVKTLFENRDETRHKAISVDAKDKLGRTPLQLAVATFNIDAARGLLADRGVDVSEFVFPTKRDFDECLEAYASKYSHQNIKISRQHWREPRFSGGIMNEVQFKVVSDFINLVHLLRRKGYELKLSDAVTLMSQLNKLGASKFWPKLSKEELIIDELKKEKLEEAKKWFEKEAKKAIVQENPKLSLYDLLELPPNAAARRLTYFGFVMQSLIYRHFQDAGYGTYIKQKLHAIMLRGFFQRWALDSFMKLVRNRLPMEVCEMIIDDSFTNQNFYNICVVVAKLQSDEDSRKNAMTNAEGQPAPKRLKLE